MKISLLPKYLGALSLVAIFTAQSSAQVLLPPLDSTVWLRADAGVVTDGGKVVQWLDQSGNAHDAQQGNGTYQPTFISNGINGNPVLRFNDNNVLSTNAVALNAANMSVFIVAAVDSQFDPFQNILTYSNEPDSSAPVIWGGFSLFNGRVAGDGASSTITTGNSRIVEAPNWMGGGTPKIGEFFFSTEQLSYLAVNGQQVGVADGMVDGTLPTASHYSGFPLRLNIGADWGRGSTPVYGLTGDIAEILVYNRALSENERLQVLDYMGEKYGIAIPEPTSIGLLALAGGFIGWVARRRTNKVARP